MRKGMKKLCSSALSILLALSMVVPGAGVYHTNVKADDVVEKTQTGNDNGKDDGKSIKGDYFRQNMAVLLKNNQLKTSNSEVTLTENEKGKGVLVSGKDKDILNSEITIDKKLNFDGKIVGRLSLDAIAERGSDITVGVFVDGGSEPVGTFKLYKQRKKNDWTYTKDSSIDVSGLKLTGEHTVSLKVLSTSASKVNFLIRAVEFVESTVPVIYFNINEEDGTIAEMNASSDHSVECYGSMTIKVPDGFVSEYTGKEVTGGTYDMEYIRGRGNSTWDTPKKPYKIKLDKKADLLGMGKNKHWVLLANYYDNSLLRNKITYWLGQQLNMAFTPKSEPVDVVMNGEYYGSYFLSQQVRVGSTRVDIDDLEESEETMNSTDPAIISGGYLLALSPYERIEHQTFSTNNNVEFKLESPKFEDYYNETQFNYIKDYVQKTEDAIYGKNFKDSNGTSYTEYMDLNAAVYYYWMQEFSMNGDGFVSPSTYLYKPRNGKLYFGPLWDFDYVAWGSTEYSGNSVTGWSRNTNMWFDKLFEDKTFARAIVDAWPSIKEKVNELIMPGGQLDKYKDEMVKTAAYNFEKWGMSDLGQDDMEEDSKGNNYLTYDQEIERLRGWIKERTEWVDKNVASIVPQPCKVKFMADNKVIATKDEYIGKTISSFPTAPKKKGYVFVGWNAHFHMNFKEYLSYIGSTEEDLSEFMEPEEIKNLKKNGYDFDGEFSSSDILVKDTTLTAKYISEREYVKERKIILNRKYMTLNQWSDEGEIKATVIPFDATNSEIQWSSSNPEVAEVMDGSVTPVKSGDTIITAKTASGLTATCKVHVCTDGESDEMPMEAYYEFPKYDYTIGVNEYKDLGVKYQPENAVFGENCKFLVGDDSVVEVSDGGVVYGLKPGTTTVYAYTNNGDPIRCQVTVVDKKTAAIENVYTVKNCKYKVLTNKDKNKTVMCVGAKNSKVKAVNIPSKVKIKNVTYKVISIKAKAFAKMKKLKKVTIGNNVSFIGKSAFYNCKNLTKVYIGKKVEIIYQNAFKGDKKLKNITIKAKRAKINKGAFSKISGKSVFKVPKNCKAYYKIVLGKSRNIK